MSESDYCIEFEEGDDLKTFVTLNSISKLSMLVIILPQTFIDRNIH